MIFHNKLCDSVSDLAGKAFTPSKTYKNTLIHQCHAVQEENSYPAGSLTKNLPESTEKLEQKGDPLILDVWQRGMDSINNIRVINTYSLFHWNKLPEKCLQTPEKNNKKKYLELYLQKRRPLYLFFVVVDGLLGIEVESTLKRIDNLLETKWKHPYSKMYGYVKIMVDITLIRATHH